MKLKPHNIPCQRLLVIMPGLLGESIMATAALHAIRQAHPDTHITALIKRRLRPVLYGLDSVDRVLSIRKRSEGNERAHQPKNRSSLIRISRRLARGNFDTALVFPLSFRAAAVPALAGIKRRIGYETDSRAVILTDRLVARYRKTDQPKNATIDSYLAFARYLGAQHPSPQMHQVLNPDACRQLTERLQKAGVQTDRQELLLVNPGAPTPERRWSPRRLAHLCEMLTQRYGLVPVVTGTPTERDVVQEVLGRTTVPIIDMPELGRDLHLLKAMVARSRMMVTNDTGPRFIAAALGVPVLTLFGPTSPQGSGLSLSHEEQVISDGISVSARNNPRFKGRASLDVLHADEVFEHASKLYETTRTLHVAGYRA